MSTTNNGGPAFPAGSVRKSRPAHDPGADLHLTDVVEPKHSGMTLRDYFAAKAMPVVWNDIPDDVNRQLALCRLGDRAYEMADAMLAARENGGAA